MLGVVTGLVTGTGGFVTGFVVGGLGDTPTGLAPGTVTIPGAVLTGGPVTGFVTGFVTGLVIGGVGKAVVGGSIESNSVNL